MCLDVEIHFYIYSKYIFRWVTLRGPGCYIHGTAGRFYKDDAVHNRSSYGEYITRIAGGVRYA